MMMMVMMVMMKMKKMKMMTTMKMMMMMMMMVMMMTKHFRQVIMRDPRADPALGVPDFEVGRPEHHALRWCKSKRHGRERKAGEVASL